MKVFIHTNDKQLFGAHISKYSILKCNLSLKENDIEIINVDSNSFFDSTYDRSIIRGGKKYLWDKNDLQSFTLLRFLPPSLMNFEGYSMVIDPDIFAVNNFINKFENFEKDKLIMARSNPNSKKGLATSLMIFNNKLCEELDLEKKVNSVLSGEFDYSDLMNLTFLEENKFSTLPKEWNSFDELDNETIFLHTTTRITQPWKTGLKVDFQQNYPKFRYKIIPNFLFKILKEILTRKKHPPYTKYIEHPNQNIQDYFFTLVSGALKENFIDKELINYNIKKHYVRSDIYKYLVL